MLDVHPPHEAAHTWKDFFIHVATICVGLLIAVGLEQTVEAIHHRHQRIELEENLRKDGELNRGWASQDMDSFGNIMEWAQGQAVVVEHAGPSGPLSLRPLTLGPINVPNFGVWIAAKTNGQVSLLSTWQQNWVADLNRSDDQMFVSDYNLFGRVRGALGDLNELLKDHAVPQSSGVLDISSLSAAQRVQVAQCLRAVGETARQLEGTLILYATGNEFLLENPRELSGEDETQRKFDKIRRRLEAQHPGIDYTFTTH
jgi:hypothetical protein